MKATSPRNFPDHRILYMQIQINKICSSIRKRLEPKADKSNYAQQPCTGSQPSPALRERIGYMLRFYVLGVLLARSAEEHELTDVICNNYKFESESCIFSMVSPLRHYNSQTT